MTKNVVMTMLLVFTVGAAPAWAQHPETPGEAHPGPGQEAAPASPEGGRDGGKDAGMTGAPAQDGVEPASPHGGAAPLDARDPDAYSGGYVRGSGRYSAAGGGELHMGDEHNVGSVLLDRLEAVRTSGQTSAAYDLQAWYGRDYNRVVLKAEGEYDDGEFEEARTELLWGRAVAAYWDLQFGVRHDAGEGPNRGWLAAGIQGLAPYWFEVEATAYLGEEGRTALRVEAEYELLLTQRLILQPRIEAEFYGKDDGERGIGSGLSEASAGVRLRYEIRREFAPYVGVEWVEKFGDTKDFARAEDKSTGDARLVAGLRIWF